MLYAWALSRTAAAPANAKGNSQTPLANQVGHLATQSGTWTRTRCRNHFGGGLGVYEEMKGFRASLPKVTLKAAEGCLYST